MTVPSTGLCRAINRENIQTGAIAVPSRGFSHSSQPRCACPDAVGKGGVAHAAHHIPASSGPRWPGTDPCPPEKWMTGTLYVRAGGNEASWARGTQEGQARVSAGGGARNGRSLATAARLARQLARRTSPQEGPGAHRPAGADGRRREAIQHHDHMRQDASLDVDFGKSMPHFGCDGTHADWLDLSDGAAELHCARETSVRSKAQMKAEGKEKKASDSESIGIERMPLLREWHGAPSPGAARQP